MSEAAVRQPEEMPVPFGVQAATGATRPPLTEEDLSDIPGDRPEVKQRASKERHLALIPGMDPMNLSKAGWGIVFAADIDPAVRAAMQPLIDHRQKQVNNPKFFKVFEGSKGVKGPKQSAVDWLDRMGVPLAVVDPRQGVPYYLLLVGSPAQISFEFQFVLDTQWCVGRVYFETAAEYEAYARAVVDYETVQTLPHKKQGAMWMTRNSGDAATGMLHNQVGLDFKAKPLGVDDGWQWQSFLNEEATKPQLAAILKSNPAVLFTGSHGLEWAMDDADGQKANQGALVTQEWIPQTAVKEDQRFGAADLDANVNGMFCFLFACFGGGCPSTDTYRKDPDGEEIAIAEAPLIARLPQKLLAKGALAVMAHVDRAWSWSFQSGSGLPQNQVIRSTMECMMGGARAGQAADFFNLQWATLAALLGIQERGRSPATLGNLYIARDDARNFTLLGDPAVKFRVEDMKA